jgi:hypothetical protein
VNDTQNGAVRVNEKRLALQDLFICTELAVMFGVGSATTTNTKLYSYNNGNIFSTSTSAADLLSLYNGYLSLSVNNELVLPAWDVLRHYFVPQTQGSVGVTAQTIFPIDQVDMENSPFYPVEPGIVMNGAANINFQLTANGAPAAITTNSFLCVVQRGILCHNTTTVK